MNLPSERSFGKNRTTPPNCGNSFRGVTTRRTSVAGPRNTLWLPSQVPTAPFISKALRVERHSTFEGHWSKQGRFKCEYSPR